MELIQLPMQKESAKLPSQLDFLSVINRRGTPYFSKAKALYRSLYAGSLGEERILEYIKKYGKAHWKVLRNVWLSHLGNFECDLMLLTHSTLYIFEVKNYTGVFRYTGGKCYFDQTETSINPVEQVRGNLADLKQILQPKMPQLKIKAAVIFTGDDNDVQVHTTPDDIEIINRTQIQNYIKKIAYEEMGSHSESYTSDLMLKQLAKYETSNPFMPPPLSEKELKEINPGIYCPHCEDNQFEISKFKIACACGLVISREEAILRTICDYGVLNYQRNFTRQEIQLFLAEHASIHIFREIMQKHFLTVKNGRGSYCINKKLLYDDLFQHEYPLIFNVRDFNLVIFNHLGISYNY